MKRVLYVSRYQNFFGGNKCLYHLVKHLDLTRFEPVLMIPEGSHYADKFVEMEVPVHEMQTSIPLKAKNLFEIAKVNFKLMAFVRLEKIAVVHINEEACLAESLLPFFLFAKMNRIGLVFHIRSAGMSFGFLKRFIFMLGKAVCVSERVRREFLKPRRSDVLAGVKEDKVIRIYDGVETEKFETPIEPGKIGAIKKSFSLNGELLVGYISAIDPRKRQDLFLEAAEKIVALNPDVRFMIVGDTYDNTPPQNEFKRKVMEMAERPPLKGKVIFTGYRSDVPDLLRMMDVFVLTSHSEGFGDVVIEAMAAGKPVVSTSDGGPSEIVTESETGYLIRDFAKAGPYAERIAALAASPDLREKMGKAGQKRAFEVFGIRTHVEQIQRVYESV